MSEIVYRKVPTSAEVYAVLRARHGDEMAVYSSYSAPDGDHFGDPLTCRMVTDWGIKGYDGPLLGAETTWEKDPEGSHKRVNEKHVYWLWQAIEPRSEA